MFLNLNQPAIIRVRFRRCKTPKIKKCKKITERRAGLQESHQEALVNEQHPKEHPVISNRDGVLMDKSPGQAPEVPVSNSEAGTVQTLVSFRN